MSKSNILRKAEVLKNGDYQAFRFTRQIINSEFRNIPVSQDNPFCSSTEALAYDSWKRANDSENWKECERLDHARIQRVARLRSKVGYMVRKSDCCFVTLTFTDEVLARTSADTRHRYVKRWLKSNFACGIANIDFGAKNGREHYHAIVPGARISHDSWKYGAVKGKTIKQADDSAVQKVACYTAKLVNHAIKETTKGCRSIYSGKFGMPTPKDHVPKHFDDVLLLERAKRINSALEDKDKEIFADSQKTHSERYMELSDADVAALDALFLKGV